MTPKVFLSEAYPGESLSAEAYDAICAKLDIRTFIVTLTPGRAGSTYLANLVSETGVCGAGREAFTEAPIEAYRKVAPDLPAFFTQAAKRSTKGGVCWIKMAPRRFEELAKVLDPVILDRVRYTTLRRRDVIAQAISYLFASRTGIWHSPQGIDQGGLGDLSMDGAVGSVMHWLRNILQAERKIAALVAGRVGVLEQFHEDIVASPLEETLRFLRHHGVQAPASVVAGVKPWIERLSKVGALELCDEVCRRSPEVARMVDRRKGIGSQIE